MYKQVYGSDGQISTKVIQRIADGVYIPNSATNLDWQDYQAWLGKGNTPTPPDLLPDPIASTRNDALNLLASDTGGHSKFVRAVLLVILDEINTIRTLGILAQTARTANQMKTAIQAKINAGAAD